MQSVGPDWILYVADVLFAVMTIAFFRGKGTSLIAGYNAMSDKEKSEYDEKKICHVMGGCFGFIDILLLIMSIGGGRLPVWFPMFFGVLVGVDIVITLILSNTYCKRK